jgi:putative spermidine/putrescine transport system substrate-binding protein
LVLLLSACSTDKVTNKGIEEFDTWNEVVEEGRDKEVTIFMWGGNENINRFMDSYVADHMKETYNITLNRVPMNAPDYLAKLINEKKTDTNKGTADLLWINAENFRTAKEGNLLDGPVTQLLPNLAKYYDMESSDIQYDSGVAIEGYEAIWGKAQLVFTYDENIVKQAPKSYKELKTFIIENPGKFTYPRVPDDFAGTAFIRSAFYEITGEKEKLEEDLTKEEFEELSKPVMDYFNDIKPYLWNEGNSYPANQAQLDDLFQNGEIYMTMGFEVGKTAGQIDKGVYPKTVKTYVFDTGTIGNSHYLAIPFNAPEKAAALLLIDFLQSPEAQIEKIKPSIWGDMPAFDVNALSEKHNTKLEAYWNHPGTIPLNELNEHRLPEMNAQYIDWIKEIWLKNVGN